MEREAKRSLTEAPSATQVWRAGRRPWERTELSRQGAAPPRRPGCWNGPEASARFRGMRITAETVALAKQGLGGETESGRRCMRQSPGTGTWESENNRASLTEALNGKCASFVTQGLCEHKGTGLGSNETLGKEAEETPEQLTPHFFLHTAGVLCS